MPWPQALSTESPVSPSWTREGNRRAPTLALALHCHLPAPLDTGSCIFLQHMPSPKAQGSGGPHRPPWQKLRGLRSTTRQASNSIRCQTNGPGVPAEPLRVEVFAGEAQRGPWLSRGHTAEGQRQDLSPGPSGDEASLYPLS